MLHPAQQTPCNDTLRVCGFFCHWALTLAEVKLGPYPGMHEPQQPTWSAMRVICPAKTLPCALAPLSSATALRAARRTSASRCSAVAASASSARASASAAAMRASSSCNTALRRTPMAKTFRFGVVQHPDGHGSAIVRA